MRLVVWLAMLLLASQVQAGTGTIEGTVTVKDPAPPAPDPEDVPFANVLVYLDGFAPGTTFPPPRQEAQLQQRKKRFIPYILPVQVGTTVRFPNDDDLFHNVFSLSKAQKFNIGRYPKGPGKTQQFNTVGRVRVFCDIHSFMKANILVLPSPHFAFPGRTGTYKIENAPEGTYYVMGFHDRLNTASAPVTVKAGQTTTVNLTIDK